MTKVKSILITILIFFSCESKWGKYGGYSMEYDSKLEYYIVLDKSDTSYNHRWKDGSVTKYDGTYIKYQKSSSNIDTTFISKGGIVIKSFVDKIEFNDQFVLVAQKPLEEICDCNPKCIENKYKNSKSLNSYNLCKEALEKSKYFVYWIIEKNADKINGPLNKKEYLQKCKELRIPSDLIFTILKTS